MSMRTIRPGFTPLVDPFLKTSRAKVHLENLRDKVAAFCSDSCEFSFQDDLERQLHIIRMKVKNVPDDIPLVAGDLFYCLRASLDQLVWGLAKLNANPGYPTRTAFPILEKRDDPLFRKRTAGVPTEAAKVIESLQPYNLRGTNSSRESLLWRLNKLCNIDKHTRIPVHGLAGTITWDSLAQFHQSDLLFTASDDGGVLKIPLDLKGKVAVNPRVIETKVVFGDLYWNIECDLGGVEAIYEFVANNVIPRFARFFQQPISQGATG